MLCLRLLCEYCIIRTLKVYQHDKGIALSRPSSFTNEGIAHYVLVTINVFLLKMKGYFSFDFMVNINHS
jgi:hypothetical protein